MEKIHCIFCGALADIIRQNSSDMVICKNCHKEKEFDTYRKILGEWLDVVCQNRMFKERRSEKDRRVADDNIMIGTDRREYRDRRT
ncbi:hypothetical protein ACFL03_15655 [Thermodesulfobacteriota bacterium]